MPESSQKTAHSGLQRDLGFLAELTRQTLGSLDLVRLVSKVVELLEGRFGYECAAVGLVEGQMLVFHTSPSERGEIPEPSERRDGPWRVPLGQGLCGVVAEDGKARLVEDASREPQGSLAAGATQTLSELAVPISHRGRVLGVIDLTSPAVATFSAEDQGLLETIATLVAPAISATRALALERRRARDLRLVNEISRLVSSSLNREELLSLACRAILEVLDVSFVALALLDETSQRPVHGSHASKLALRTEIAPQRLFQARIPGVLKHALEQGRCVCDNAVEDGGAYGDLVSNTRSELIVPLRVVGQTVGVVTVADTRAGRFSDEDQSLLTQIAGFLAQSIDNARLFDSQRRRWLQLLLVNEVARVASMSPGLDQTVRLVAEQTQARFGYSAVAVFLKEESSLVLQGIACEGTPDAGRGFREEPGRGVIGRSVVSGRTMRARSPAEFEGSPALVRGVCCCLSVPLRSAAETIGALVVQDARPNTFEADSRLVIETLAKSVAGLIANARERVRGERLREDLANMVVHDLRNPLQAILLTLQKVARLDLPLNALEHAGEGMQVAEEILEMVNSLLDVARFEAGNAAVRRTPASVNDHIRSVVRRFAAQAEARSVSLGTDLCDSVPVLHLDHELIHRMLSNLVSNALKFTKAGQRVSVRTRVVDSADQADAELRQAFDRCQRPSVLLSVSDTGEGIPEAYRSKIFEKFGQVESRKAGWRMSTGLGLTLCRYVVEAHEGHIWVESQVNVGSTFHVVLPTPAAAASGARRSASVGESPEV